MEQIHAIVIVDDGSDRLGQLWASANSQQKLQIESTLRYLAGTELDESACAVEFRHAQGRFGALVPAANNAFRAISRILAPHVSAWELAAATVHRLRSTGKLPTQCYVAQAAASLQDKRPLPRPNLPLQLKEVTEFLQSIVQLWPMRIELQSILTDVKILSYYP